MDVRPSYFSKKLAAPLVERIIPYIAVQNKIIDIGCGSCFVAQSLLQKGFNVAALVDIENKGRAANIKPLIYDGETLPFPDNSFDVALLLNVLHHAKNPKKTLSEARRTVKKIIVIEDIHRNTLQKILMLLMDSVLNLELSYNLVNHKSDAEWKSLFEKLKLRIVKEKQITFWKLFGSATYVLTRT